MEDNNETDSAGYETSNAEAPSTGRKSMVFHGEALSGGTFCDTKDAGRTARDVSYAHSVEPVPGRGGQDTMHGEGH